MNILICPDKFKLTFSASAVASIIADIITFLGHRPEVIPLSDGGDGFLEVIETVLPVRRIYGNVYDPLCRRIRSYILWDSIQRNVYIELAKTGSMSLIPPRLRNPMNTTTIGLGQQIKQAIALNPEKIYIGLGGSSTTDAGIGMASALGYVFKDWKGNILFPIGRNLLQVQTIEKPELSLPQIFACVDVDNLLYGPQGAAFVYAPQKGASGPEVTFLDRGLRNIAAVVEKDLGIKLNTMPGEGAAGGLGAGIRAFLNGKIISGAEMIITLTRLEEKIRQADMVITGEGKFDSQSLQGKITGQVIKLAQKYSKPVVVITGISQLDENIPGVHLISLFDRPVDIKTAIEETPQKIKQKLTQFFNTHGHK